MKAEEKESAPATNNCSADVFGISERNAMVMTEMENANNKETALGVTNMTNLGNFVSVVNI
jgi:hypothetical protein